MSVEALQCCLVPALLNATYGLIFWRTLQYGHSIIRECQRVYTLLFNMTLLSGCCNDTSYEGLSRDTPFYTEKLFLTYFQNYGYWVRSIFPATPHDAEPAYRPFFVEY